jgi:hypothetical protein
MFAGVPKTTVGSNALKLLLKKLLLIPKELLM